MCKGIKDCPCNKKYQLNFELEPFEAYPESDNYKGLTAIQRQCKRQTKARPQLLSEYGEEQNDVFSEFKGESEYFDVELFPEVLEREVNRQSSEYIRWVQQSLNKILGLRLAVDGILGPQTRSAIRSFQQKNGLTVDGIVGTHTEARLMALSGVQSWGATPVSASVVPRSLPSPCFSQSHFPCPQTTVIDHFAVGKTVVEPSHRANYDSAIQNLAACIASSLGGFLSLPYGVISIAGHTSGEGSEASNVALGQARADQVAGDLKTSLLSHGLTVGTFYVTPIDGVIILQTKSFGETALRIKPELTESDRKQNRRVEINLSSLFRKAPGPAPAPAGINTLINKVKQTLGSLPLGTTGIVLPTAARFLDPAEQAEAMRVYRGSLDFTKIVITDGLGYRGRKFTVAVPLTSGWHVALNMGSLQCWARRPQSVDLIHELAHAWQSQHHGSDPTAFMFNSVKCQGLELAQSRVTGKRFSAYAYISGMGFGQYSAEQIAQQVQHHYQGRGRPTPIVLPTIQAARRHVRVVDNEASLKVVVVHEIGVPGVIPP